MTKLSEIAQLAGCSPATVSRALSVNPDASARMSKETYRSIMKAAQALGYRPNRNAEFLRRGKSPTIGVFLPKYRNDLIAAMVMGISEAAERLSFPLAFSFESTVGYYKKFMEKVYKGQNIGIITFPHFVLEEDSHGLIENYCRNGGKLVILNTGNTLPDLHQDVISVEIDDFHGGVLAAEHILKNGCETVFGMCGIPRRKQGFSERLKESDKEAVFFTEKESSYNEIIKKCLNTSSTVGIFCAADRMAVHMHSMLLRNNLIPGDRVKLIGFDDMSLTAHLSPSLTTISQPLEEVGKCAVEQLVASIYGKKPVSSQFRPKLVIRETC